MYRYLRSRTPAEIQRRVDNLLKALEKKQQEEDAVVQQVEAEKRKKELLDKRKVCVTWYPWIILEHRD